MNNINQEIQDLEATLVSLKVKAKAQQEPTLTPVSFESKAELAKALIDGRTFKTPAGSTLMYDEDTRFSSPFRIMFLRKDKEAMKDVWNLYADLQEINAAPQPWYLNIPRGGIECYVSDHEPNPSPSFATRIIREYHSGYRLPFSSNYVGYKYATPVNGGK